MKLEKNEYTSRGLIEMLSDKYGTKHSGKKFNVGDITQYARRGFLPYRYGGNKLEVDHVQGIKIIRVLDEVHRDQKEEIADGK
jgi:hypothetical protein